MNKGGPCIYCHHIGVQSEFSVEHVIQESIGGRLRLPADFVCKECNDEMGRTIDGAVSKYFEIQRLDFGARAKSGKELKHEGTILGRQGQ